MTTVFVSPHLDDVVLSAPGRVLTLSEQGERVVVLTVFTEGDARHAERREEDRRALAMLGAEPVHLGLLDAPFRRNIPWTYEGLIVTPLPENDPDTERVGERLAAALAGLAARAVFLPLGVGEHIDHRVVHRAGARIGGEVAFYEDRPYALVSGAVEARLAALGAGPEGTLRLVPDREVFEDRVLDAAVSAIEVYASQVPELFPGGNVRTAIRGGGRPYEELVHRRAAPHVSGPRS